MLALCTPNTRRRYGAYTDGTQHAFLWTGGAASAVNLHPAGFRSSVVNGVNNGRQVGSGLCSDGTKHALLWKGNAASVINLHPFLPTGFMNSVATGIDAAGNIVGYGWNAAPTSLRNDHVFLWEPK